MSDDLFGIKKIYPTSGTNPQEFFLPMKISELDTSVFNDRFILNTDIFNFRENETDDDIEFWFMLEEEDVPVEWYWIASGGAPSTPDCGVNHSSLESQGYLFKSSDLKNVEITGYFFVDGITDQRARINIFARNGLINSDSSSCCSGTAYGTRLYVTNTGPDVGKISHFKRQWFPSEVEKEKTSQTTVPTFYQRWFGVKFVVYNNVINDTITEVHIETYICTSDNPSEFGNWILVKKTIDKIGSGWGNQGGVCNATNPDQPITWGGYLVGFSWEDTNAMQFKFVSVREIQPPTNPTGGGGNNPLPPCNDDDDPIPPVEDGSILYQNTSWSNGQVRTITGHHEFDPFDDRVNIGAGENRELHIHGDGTAHQSGARARQFILAPNYNASMTITFVPNSSLDNLSLRLRSRHGENDPVENRFGGYGCAIGHNSIELNRENFHNDHEKYGDHSFSPALTDGQEYTARYTCQDVNNGVKLTCEIDYGSGFVKKAEAIDTNPLDYMLDKDLYLTGPNTDGASSTAWVRTNGDAPEEVLLKTIIIRNIDHVPGTGNNGGNNNNNNNNCTPTDPTDPIPPVDPLPDNTCPLGYHYNSEFDRCFPDNPCPPNFHLNQSGVCVPNVVPPDNPPPPTPSTIRKRIILRRSIINDSFCQCDGVDLGGGNDPGGGSGGGGGSNSLTEIYNLNHNDAKFSKLSKNEGSEEHYLRYGQYIKDATSVFVGVKIVRIEIFLEEKDNPRNSSLGGLHCVLRKKSDDSILVDFGTISEDDLSSDGKVYKFENLGNADPVLGYACQQGDILSFEYDGGDHNDYIKIFRKKQSQKTGSKVVKQDNEMDAGEWDEDKLDICMRVLGIPSS